MAGIKPDCCRESLGQEERDNLQSSEMSPEHFPQYLEQVSPETNAKELWPQIKLNKYRNSRAYCFSLKSYFELYCVHSYPTFILSSFLDT